jgi:hypothetical protein
MKKITRAHVENPESSRLRVPELSRETVRVLTPTDLANAAGGSCDTGSYPTTIRTNNGGGAIGG